MASAESYKKSLGYYGHVSLFWTDLISLMSSRPQSLMSTGPFRKLGVNSKKISAEMIEINQDLAEFNTRITEYYKQLTTTWNEAQKQFEKKVPEIPTDTEHIDSTKRIWIDIFENYFTRLFDSTEFAENFGKLVSSELELARRWSNVTSLMLETVNMPTKKEIDELYKELHLLRKRVAKLEKIDDIGVNSNGK
ncbi:MAG: poly(R)-hydroxyalkanoic acid synthase subunit PhaE [Nitrosotalea sp.]